MALPRPFRLPAHSFRTACAVVGILGALAGTAWSDAVTAGGDESVPASRLPVARAKPGSTSRTCGGTPARGTASPHKCGDAQPGTPRS